MHLRRARVWLSLWCVCLAVGCRANPAPRVLIVGWDGASWDVAAPLIEAGRMPHLAKLMRSGAWAPLTTLSPTISPAIWTSIATGKEPRRHGILGFDGVPGRTMTTLPSASMRRTKAFWNILDDQGLTSATVGFWCTWPAESFATDSVMVSDHFAYTRMEASIGERATTAGDVYPARLEVALRPLVLRPNAIPASVTREFLGLSEEEHARLLETPYAMGRYLPEFKYVYQSDRSALRIALSLMKQRRRDVTTVYFTGIDTLSHLFWHFYAPEHFPKGIAAPAEIAKLGGVIPRYYALMDAYLGQLIAAAGPDVHVIVLSDHGFGPTGRLPWSGGHDAITPGAPHAPPGILVLSGPSIRQGVRMAQAHVFDVVPTLLAVFRLPLAMDMAGAPLRAALRALPRARAISSYDTRGKPWRPPAPPSDVALDERERIERLRALGYAK